MPASRFFCAMPSPLISAPGDAVTKEVSRNPGPSPALRRLSPEIRFRKGLADLFFQLRPYVAHGQRDLHEVRRGALQIGGNASTAYGVIALVISLLCPVFIMFTLFGVRENRDDMEKPADKISFKLIQPFP